MTTKNCVSSLSHACRRAVAGRLRTAALMFASAAILVVAASCGSSDSTTAVDDGQAPTSGAMPSASAPAESEQPSADPADTAEADGAAMRSALIAEMSDMVGGLTAASSGCVDEVLAGDPALAEALASDAGSVMSPGLLAVIACLTPEEAAVLMPPEGDDAPAPDDFACLMDQLEGKPESQRILAVLSGADASGEGLTLQQSAVLGEAVEACGIETDFSFPDADDGPGSVPSDLNVVGDGRGECTVGLMLYPGDQCSYGSFSMTIREDGAVVVDGSIGGITMGNTVMQSETISLNQFSATRNGTTWTIESLP